MQFRRQPRPGARHASRRPPRARQVVVVVVAALAVVVAVPALAIALGDQRSGAQVGGVALDQDAKTDRTVTTPRPSQEAEPTVEATPEATVEPTPEPTQATPSPAPEPAEPTRPAPARAAGPGAQIEADIVAVTNTQRAAHGLGALSVASCATDQARGRVAQLVAENGFYHPPMETVVAACKVGAGENLALGYSTGAGVVDGWMNSPGHRANLLEPRFVSLGVSCQQQNGRWLCGAVYLMS
ncbi:MAG: CAP domain-containing protein [Micrococcales bacterium]|nr:CAP domain-containing protein [Micrococcales bacterium]